MDIAITGDESPISSPKNLEPEPEAESEIPTPTSQTRTIKSRVTLCGQELASAGGIELDSAAKTLLTFKVMESRFNNSLMVLSARIDTLLKNMVKNAAKMGMEETMKLMNDMIQELAKLAKALHAPLAVVDPRTKKFIQPPQADDADEVTSTTKLLISKISTQWQKLLPQLKKMRKAHEKGTEEERRASKLGELDLAEIDVQSTRCVACIDNVNTFLADADGFKKAAASLIIALRFKRQIMAKVHRRRAEKAATVAAAAAAQQEATALAATGQGPEGGE